ncbi:hypothetical protein NKCBBBOE_01670 [Pseudarthrobacter sp. MM222]|nr:hypothetical protein NKCBBBOE_01670 [Pseudarthrobacter sp. MM222]
MRTARSAALAETVVGVQACRLSLLPPHTTRRARQLSEPLTQPQTEAGATTGQVQEGFAVSGRRYSGFSWMKTDLPRKPRAGCPMFARSTITAPSSELLQEYVLASSGPRPRAYVLASPHSTRRSSPIGRPPALPVRTRTANLLLRRHGRRRLGTMQDGIRSQTRRGHRDRKSLSYRSGCLPWPEVPNRVLGFPGGPASHPSRRNRTLLRALISRHRSFRFTAEERLPGFRPACLVLSLQADVLLCRRLLLSIAELGEGGLRLLGWKALGYSYAPLLSGRGFSVYGPSGSLSRSSPATLTHQHLPAHLRQV